MVAAFLHLSDLVLMAAVEFFDAILKAQGFGVVSVGLVLAL